MAEPTTILAILGAGLINPWFLAIVAWMILGVLAYRWHRSKQTLQSQRDEAEARVEAGQRRFLGIATRTKEAMIVIDAEGDVVFWNNAAEKLFGWTAKQMVGQPLYRIIPKRFQGPHSAALARLRAGEPPRLMDKVLNLTACHASGEEFPIELALGQWSDIEDPAPGQWTYVGIVRRKRPSQPQEGKA